MFDEKFLLQALIAAPAILFSLTVHEFFHAWSALKFGDTTARDLGRLTLNPLAHLDLFGTIMMFVSQFRFGWAKPVPVNLNNVRDPRWANLWISAAGPLSNVGLSIIFAVIYRVLYASNMTINPGFEQFLYYAVAINVSLAVFNIIPLFPLDGSHILRALLPESYGPSLDQFDRIAPFLLIILILVGGVSYLLWPVVGIALHFLLIYRIG